MEEDTPPCFGPIYNDSPCTAMYDRCRGGPPRLTFGNLLSKDLSITSSILCIALSIDYTFEFFRSEPKRNHPKTLQ